MSLFGSSPPDDGSAALNPAKIANSSRSTLFDNEAPTTRSGSALFADDDHDSPWDMPTPRKQRSRADLIRNLLPSGDVPESYIETFDAVVRTENRSTNGRITAGGVARTLAAAKLGADDQARIMGIIAPASASATGAGGGGDGAHGGEANSSAAAAAAAGLGDLGRNEFNVLLALIGLVQEGEVASLDGVDERRRNLPQPKLQGLVNENVQPVLPNLSELAAKPPQRPVTPPKAPTSSPPKQQQQQQHQPPTLRKVSMEYPEDPWNAPDLHKGHNHGPLEHSTGHNGAADVPRSVGPDLNGNDAVSYSTSPEVTTTSSALPGRTTSTFTTSQPPSGPSSIHNVAESIQESNGAWNYFPGSSSGGGFGEPADNAITGPFSDSGGPGQSVSGSVGGSNPNRSIGHVRSGSNVEENILVTLMPEKEGVFMFQHHNYEVSSIRRGSKVVRRYSDFVWLLDCLHKRYPFRVLPLLPPKRVAFNGNHLSNDGAFIEKRRRGLARFLNALVRHPVLGQEQLVIMFLTVPTELSVWRKQATISVQDEFTGRTLPPGLEDSLPPTLEELFARTRAGVRRSAELYISTCTIMDRLIKRSEGVAADHARMAVSLISLTETSADTYATDHNDVPLLNDGLQAMGRHLRTAQTLMEDEAKAWEEGVLEDLKRQRDALVSLRDMFDRRDRLDKDNIPFLQRRIETNEAKLQALNAKPEGMVKPGEKERVVEAIIKDKESIVTQHNRSVFVKECIRDELRFFQNTQYNVSRLTQDWAQERVKYSEMLADNWRRLLDDLEGMPLGD
ncbi:sorting nexin mvp-1 [Neurospora tetrasperma FGSC 2508]|uniref:Sorting nexin MVP1 n=1 Tax=Neurospora tetrasperma (strain FGSC 2508 / ATCC MYA-4615 / P0657) TaxID=510951 RepID=F8MK06_NEUT8|nr:sorting nexin mvp-1 [Neurospora tetrasperma FGSC 2508]EGO57343.1 sorting nexin mvp-1 [Neurospora tetrasperma FGSC 2508]EGZ72404.1 sorting nexin mvp-1 [Neurospora tetrasperma FGSC 2509]